MAEYPNAGRGLRLMFTARIGALVCLVAAIIPVIGLLGIIGVFVFLVLGMVGLYTAGKDLDGCHTAFILSIVQLVANLFKNSPGLMGTVLGLTSDILSLLVVYFVISSVNEALEGIGYGDVARTGSTVWKLQLACFFIGIVVTILALITAIEAIAGISVFVVLILSLIEGIMFLYYLYKSYMALE